MKMPRRKQPRSFYQSRGAAACLTLALLGGACGGEPGSSHTVDGGTDATIVAERPDGVADVVAATNRDVEASDGRVDADGALLVDSGGDAPVDSPASDSPLGNDRGTVPDFAIVDGADADAPGDPLSIDGPRTIAEVQPADGAVADLLAGDAPARDLAASDRPPDGTAAWDASPSVDSQPDGGASPSCMGGPEDSVCSEDCWCWSNPWPLGNDLWSILVIASNDIWAGGDTGTIIHYDGTRWRRTPHAGTRTIYGFWASAPSNVWAVGGIGTLLHWNGDAWQDYSFSTPVVSFNAVWGSVPNDVWAAGLNGALYWWDGQSWSAALSGTTATISSLWGSSTSDVWAGLRDGSFLHFDGGGWRKVASPLAGAAINSVWGNGANDVWANTHDTILHYDGATWTVQKTGLVNVVSGINNLWGTGPSDMWAALSPISATDPQLAHWDGLSWATVSINLTRLGGITQVAGAGPSNVWAVGIGGTIVHGDGAQFTNVTTSAIAPTTNLRSIAVAAENDVWVGSVQLRHQATGGWQPAPPVDSMTSFTLLWTADPGDMWAVTTSILSLGFSRWNGTAWSARQDIDFLASPSGLWGASPTDVWIAGYPGAHLTAGVWQRQQSLYQPTAVWGFGPSDVWMVGGTGTALHFDGQQWTGISDGNAGTFWGIWGAAPDNVYLVGDSGDLRHWDGLAWTKVQSGTSARLRAIWGRSSDDVWVVGAQGLILHRTGGSWVTSPSGTARNLTSLTGTAAGEVWIVGDGGLIMHRRAF